MKTSTLFALTLVSSSAAIAAADRPSANGTVEFMNHLPEFLQRHTL